MIRILIVDDDLEIIRSLGNTFTTLLKGYLVLTATTANQGLNFIKEHKPELIIMDVRLGPLSGMDLLEDYPKYTEDYRPSVIVITAYDDEAAKKKAEELKVDAYLLKPFDPRELVRAALVSLKKCHDAQSRSLDLALRGFGAAEASVTETRRGLDEKIKNRKPPS